ncbi:hypothetical protein C8J56DRAFT_1041682 [Mycena floridula]|nr:hypothetical protein C8J56DRAFT_1041682 [Mycena floridula]
MMSLALDNADVAFKLPNYQHRVYKRVLIARVPFFADLFTVASPSAAEKTKDGLPLIEMPDDEEHFTVFLHIIFDLDLTSYFDQIAPRRTIGVVSGVLDIADKYTVEFDVLSVLMPFILRDWADSLSSWDQVEQKIHPLFLDIKEKRTNEPEDDGELPTLDALLPDPAEAIDFAVRYTKHLAPYHHPPFLAAAFYHLSRLSPDADPEEQPSLINEDDHDDGVRTAKRSLLRPRDMISLMSGIDSLHNKAASIAVEGFPHHAQNPERPGKHWDFPDTLFPASQQELQGMLRWWTSVGVERLLGPGRRDILRSLKDLIVALEFETGGIATLNTRRAGDYNADVSVEETEASETKIREETELLYRSTSPEYREAMRLYLVSEREQVWPALDKHFQIFRW